jgi:hypothetical protein
MPANNYRRFPVRRHEGWRQVMGERVNGGKIGRWKKKVKGKRKAKRAGQDGLEDERMHEQASGATQPTND